MANEQRARIIEVAQKMFIEEGVKAVRMDDIAQAMGISKRTLYESFHDKEELLYQAMLAHSERHAENNMRIAASAPNVLVAVLLVLDSSAKDSETTWRVYNALRRFYPATHDRLQNNSGAQHTAEFKAALEQGKIDGLLTQDLNIELSFSLLKYMASGVIHNANELALPNGITRQEAFRYVMISFLRGISTSKGLEVIDKYIETIK
ncbi:MAG: TetR/AcrR family transcriptional regulator [Rikenellaceae bacterium]